MTVHWQLPMKPHAFQTSTLVQLNGLLRTVTSVGLQATQ